ncbi:MAG: ArsC family transcriptional regulator [Leptospira sp.]|nr:ArsC family transcriptional regulator [Leptospira sp.]NCS94572.1 ArsC family transcriptional regulator [Leptospira sp.]
MNLQIFGTKKCSNTKKAEMFFKERRIKFQLINLSEKPMSKGELTSILSSVTLDDLIDINSKLYKEKNLQYMKFDKMEILLEFPLLLKTPIVRDGKKATVGFQPDVWKTWIV